MNKANIAVSAMTTCKKEIRDRHFESYESIQAAAAAHFADKDKYYFSTV